MRFVALRTAIPLPRVWTSIPHPFRRGTEVIFMDRLTGVSLEDAWDHLSDEKKGIVAEQLEDTYLSFALCLHQVDSEVSAL